MSHSLQLRAIFFFLVNHKDGLSSTPCRKMKGIVGWKWLKHVETHLSPFQRTLLPGPTARPQGVWGTGHFETSLRCWAAFLSVKRDRVHQHRSALVLHVWVLDTDLWCKTIKAPDQWWAQEANLQSACPIYKTLLCLKHLLCSCQFCLFHVS